MNEVNQLKTMIAGLCDAIKRLERAIETGNSSYIEECREKRKAVESKVLK